MLSLRTARRQFANFGFTRGILALVHIPDP